MKLSVPHLVLHRTCHLPRLKDARSDLLTPLLSGCDIPDAEGNKVEGVKA